ncbi:Polyribonucleotide nucleotidyltransferase [Gracilaria domingensis]|nr:Polyribonucleotide nucleotidyltransferase [Gracilaria domingensis]
MHRVAHVSPTRVQATDEQPTAYSPRLQPRSLSAVRWRSHLRAREVKRSPPRGAIDARRRREPVQVRKSLTMSCSTACFVAPLPLLRRHEAPFGAAALPRRVGAPRRAGVSRSVMIVADESDDPAEVPDTDMQERKRLQESMPSSFSIPVPPEPTVVSVEFAPGKTAFLETGHFSRQAAGAVNIRHGDTVVYCTACADKETSPSIDFLPLRVDYAEKFSSLGRTSGSYIKREGRPSEREILVSRLIGSIRPMFVDGYYNDVQILANVFSYDPECPADALSICAAAASLHISHIPLAAPVAGVRIAFIEDQFVVEPSVQQANDSCSELVIAGTEDAILMIEGYCEFLTEQQIIQATRIAHQSIVKLCGAMRRLREICGREKNLSCIRVVPDHIHSGMEQVVSGLDEALLVAGKKEREERVSEVKNRVFNSLKPPPEDFVTDPTGAELKNTELRIAWKQLLSNRMRRRILDDNIRPDGRDPFTVRPITIHQAPLPRAHGSSLFTRGETQTLAVATLGGEEMAQRYETLDGEDASRFYLQYSFPPSSVGEVGRIGAPGRREIGHGKLAERALYAVIPERKDFPYVLRVESNIFESNGSSSMASVCGGCLALLEAGVPLKSSVAGVAMGLVIDEEVLRSGAEVKEQQTVVLTDILGLEDALGLCDAKFAGNRHGLSALQLDVKLKGISIDLLERILMQAREGRLHILDCMDAVMPGPNSKLPDSLPKVVTFEIPVRRIGDVIGAGGKTIRSVIEECGGEDVIRISIDNDGTVSLTSNDPGMIAKARSTIKGLTMDLEVGTIIRGQVTKILPFGAYVKIAEGKEGWLHISELENKRTSAVQDVCDVGDELELKITDVSRNGQIRVSRRALLPREKPLRKKAEADAVGVSNGNGNNGASLEETNNDEIS